MTVTREMISAAHAVTIARGDVILRAELAQPDFRCTGSRLRRAGHGLW